MNTSARLFSFYTFFVLSLFLKPLRSEHKLPQFAGLWYDNTEGPNSVPCLGLDSCGVNIYNYISGLVSSPLDLFSEAPSGCVWEYDTFVKSHDYVWMPTGFISDNPDDWAQILLDPTAPVPSCYQMLYYCKDGNATWCRSIDASPAYTCPPNTRLSYDNVTFEIGCTTTPTPCLADIVGRDLGLDVVGFFGHVGLVATYGIANPSILEVLNGTNAEPSKIGIFLDPLYGENSFVTQTKYWGSRSGPQNFTRLPLTSASQVIQAGTDQQQYNFNYTIGWFYYPGGTEEYPDSCEFRCDSFVYYCYEKGAQIKLQPYFEYPLTVPLSMFTYDFSCSADPVEYCSAYEVKKQLALLHNNEIDENKLKPPLNTMQRTMTASLKIFQSLRPALATKSAQKNKLLRLIEQYQGHQNLTISELFVRCLCFELEKMNPSQLDQNIKPLLSNLLWQHKYLSNDNFLLAIMENTLSFYLENPHCDWLSAFFTVKAEAQEDKEAGMIAYVDQQDSVTEKANLVTASRFSLLSSLSDEKRRAYGSLFRQAYHTDEFLPERSKKLIFLSLSEMKTPVIERKSPEKFFQQSNYSINKDLRKVVRP